jgi:hypothetical protein
MPRVRESGFNRTQGLKRANHETRTRKKYKRNSDLRPNKDISRAMALPAYTSRSPCTSESLCHLGTNVFERRDQAQEKSRKQRKQQSERERPRIKRNLVQTRQLTWPDRDQKSKSRAGKSCRHEASGNTEDSTLDEEYANYSC